MDPLGLGIWRCWGWESSMPRNNWFFCLAQPLVVISTGLRGVLMLRSCTVSLRAWLSAPGGSRHFRSGQALPKDSRR